MALRGVRVLELAGLAPVPFCGMILADFGADVIRVDKAYGDDLDSKLGRGKKSIAVDIKRKEGQLLVSRLAAKSDVLIEPYRAGVMEKLGLGPKPLCEVNPRLIYARLTGYGQDGPLSSHAGHDINFLSYSGLLWAMGAPKRNPSFPINLMADFAGGGLMCAFEIASALYQRTVTGRGQVIDLSMTQGAAYVGSWLWRSRSTLPFVWTNPDEPGNNLLDGGRAFYTTYKTKDGGFVALGSLEPRFFQVLLQALEVDDPDEFDQFGDQDKLREKFAKIFAKHDRKHWENVAKQFPNSCFTPVFTLDEAPEFAHAKATNAFMKQPDELGGGYEPSPPSLNLSVFSEQKLGEEGTLKSPPDPLTGEHTRSILRNVLGLSQTEITDLHNQQVVECTGDSKTTSSNAEKAKL